MFLLHEFHLGDITDSSNAELWFNGSCRIKIGAESGTITTNAHHPRLVKNYCGFEVLPDDSGIRVSLIDEHSQECFWNGSLWLAGVLTNTPEQIREGLNDWVGSVRVKLHLTRMSGGRSPEFKSIKLGADVSGNGGSLRSYILSYGLPQMFSDPVELTRWVDDPVEAPKGVALANIVDSQSKPFGAKHLLTFRYRCLVESLYSEYQVTEAPCILLQGQATHNHRQMNEVDSIRLSDDMTRLSMVAMVCDQSIEITVIAQNAEDVAVICDHILQTVEFQNYVDVPPYALKIGCAIAGGIRTDEPIAAISEGQLPSAVMELVLFSLPMGARESDTHTLVEIEKPLINNS